jgi:hypothetical protein
MASLRLSGVDGARRSSRRRRVEVVQPGSLGPRNGNGVKGRRLRQGSVLRENLLRLETRLCEVVLPGCVNDRVVGDQVSVGVLAVGVG